MPAKNKNGQETWTSEEGREYLSRQNSKKIQGNRQKFGNVKSVIDGIEFDSQKEARYYGILKMRVKAGSLKKFEVHVVYPLIVHGNLICKYEADFVLHYMDGSTSVVDVKSVATQGLAVFRLKKALMLAIYKINVQIV